MATNTNKNKPASKPLPAKPTPPSAHAKPATPAKPAQARDVDDDLGDDLEDAGERPEGAASDKVDFNKLPPAKRVAVRLTNELARLTKQVAAINAWPGDRMIEVRGHLNVALDNLKQAGETLNALPDDYRPRVAKAAGGGKSREIAAGDLVMITDKRREEYAGVLEPDQMRGIKVVELRGNKVVTTTKDGMKAMFARGHVCLDEEAMAAATQPTASN